MSGGSSSKKSTAQATTPEEAQIAARVIPAFMPGQQGLLAQQLAAGGYGTPDEWTGILGGMYSDMSLPVINGAQDIAALKKMNEAAAKAGTTSAASGTTAPDYGYWAGPQMGGYDR